MDFDKQLLRRFLEGKAKKGDKETILAWFSDLRIENDLRKEYRQIWTELPEKPDIKEYDGSVILDRIYHTLKLEESATFSGRSGLTRIINILSKVAAVLFIALVTFLFINRNNVIPTGDKTAYSEIFSPLGTRTMFYLSDGSSGWLNGGSTLKFPIEFKGRTREVILRGEGYFDVLSDNKKPFVVSGEQIEVVAYGTSFNVMAYPEDHISAITLVSGSVEVLGKRGGDAHSFGLLEPNQMCTYVAGASSPNITSVDVDKITAWKEGKLIFRNEPFSEVVKKINRWYNVEIVIKDEILDSYVYMATFQDETLDEVLKLITLSAPIRFEDFDRELKPDRTFTKRKIELYYKP